VCTEITLAWYGKWSECQMEVAPNARLLSATCNKHVDGIAFGSMHVSSKSYKKSIFDGPFKQGEVLHWAWVEGKSAECFCRQAEPSNRANAFCMYATFRKVYLTSANMQGCVLASVDTWKSLNLCAAQSSRIVKRCLEISPDSSNTNKLRGL
jgi:hypothetical protein